MPRAVGGIGIGVLRLERRRVARLDVIDQHLVRLEGREFGGELGAHRRQGAARVDAEMGQARAAELDILVGVVAIGPGDVQEQILGRNTLGEPAFEIVADCLADPEPGLAGGQRVKQVGRAEPAGGAIERPGTAGMRVGAGHHRAGQAVGVLGDDDMADALVGSDIVKAADAETAHKVAAADMHRGTVAVGGRHVVVEHDDDLVRVVHLQHLAPRAAREAEVDQHGEIDIDDREITGRYLRRAARPRQDLLDDRHAHRPVPYRGRSAALKGTTAPPGKLIALSGVQAKARTHFSAPEPWVRMGPGFRRDCGFR